MLHDAAGPRLGPSRPVGAPRLRPTRTILAPAARACHCHVTHTLHSPARARLIRPWTLPPGKSQVARYEFSATASHPARPESRRGRPGPRCHGCSLSTKPSSKPELHSTPPMARPSHAMCQGEKAGAEPRTAGYRALRYAKGASCPPQSQARAPPRSFAFGRAPFAHSVAGLPQPALTPGPPRARHRRPAPARLGPALLHPAAGPMAGAPSRSPTRLRGHGRGHGGDARARRHDPAEAQTLAHTAQRAGRG